MLTVAAGALIVWLVTLPFRSRNRLVLGDGADEASAAPVAAPVDREPQEVAS
jgi:spermidine/putrescine transport system permease protein